MNPFKVLGLRSGATYEQAKLAYKKLAHKVHPDLHPDDLEATRKMTDINKAWELISESNAETFGKISENPLSAAALYFGVEDIYSVPEVYLYNGEFAKHLVEESGSVEDAMLLINEKLRFVKNIDFRKKLQVIKHILSYMHD